MAWLSTTLAAIPPYIRQAFFEKRERLAERVEPGTRRARVIGVTLDFPLAVWGCGAVAEKTGALRFSVVLPGRDGFPAPRFSFLTLREEERSGVGKLSGCHAGSVLVARFCCRLVLLDVVSLSCSGCACLLRG